MNGYTGSCVATAEVTNGALRLSLREHRAELASVKLWLSMSAGTREVQYAGCAFGPDVALLQRHAVLLHRWARSGAS